MDFRLQKIIDQLSDAGKLRILKRRPLPAEDAREYARRCGEAAVWTWSSHDRTPRAAWCARCESSFLICSEVVQISKTGMCRLCSLPELKGEAARAQRAWWKREKKDRADLARLKAQYER